MAKVKKPLQIRQRRKSKNIRHITSIEYRVITFVMRVHEPIVWSFLATAIGVTIGQAIQRQ